MRYKVEVITKEKDKLTRTIEVSEYNNQRDLSLRIMIFLIKLKIIIEKLKLYTKKFQEKMRL